MAKKSFIGGLGSLLEDSFAKVKKDKKEEVFEDEDLEKRVAYLEMKLARQDEELQQWRTGELTVEKFSETLKKHNLDYIPEDNSFKKLE